MDGEVVERDGKLFVLDPWQNHFTQPIKYRYAWPTGLFSKDYPDFVGKLVNCRSDGIYRMPDGRCFRLEFGGETHPDMKYSEERLIPKPQGCHEYRNGRWVR